MPRSSLTRFHELEISKANLSTLFQKYTNVFLVASGQSPEGINLNSHGRSDGTLVPERNPWPAKVDANPEGGELTALAMFNPFRVGLSMGQGHGFRLCVTHGYSN